MFKKGVEKRMVVKNYGISIIFPIYKTDKWNLKVTNCINIFYDEYPKRELEIILIIDNPNKNDEQKINEIKKYLKHSLNIITVLNQKRMGKGYALKTGFQIAKNKIVGFVDADESINCLDIINAIEMMNNKKEVVVGVRKLNQYPSKIRKMLSILFNLYIRSVLKLSISDSQCGLKFFKKDVINKIINKMKIDGFAIDVEILYLLKRENVKITKMNININKSKISTVTLSSIFEMMRDVLRIRLVD